MSLKELLGEELYSQVTTKLGETKIAVVSDGSYIPKTKFDDKLQEIKDLKTEISNRDVQIGTLKTSAQGNEDLTKEIDRLQGENKAWEGKYAGARKEYQVKLQAASLNAHDVSDILKLVDLESLTLDDNGEVKGLEEALNKIKEDKPYFFKQQEEPKLGGRTPKDLGTPPATGITKEQFNQMGYADRMKIYNETPELYQKLNTN